MDRRNPKVNRRLLVNGEALALDVTKPQSGGGKKHEPRTSGEAIELILPQLREAVKMRDNLDPALRADGILYVDAKLLPNYISASDFPDKLLHEIGAIPVGSRPDRGIYETEQQAKEVATRRLILAVQDGGLDHFERILAEGAHHKSGKDALEEVKKIDEIRVSQSATSWPADSVESLEDFNAWESVLHPSTEIRGELVPADQLTIEKWRSLVESVGGEVIEEYSREFGGLTFVPIRVPAATVPQLSRFNPLRTLRPMPRLRPRPRLELRSLGQIQPPAKASNDDFAVRVAVFDGGVDHSTDLARQLIPVRAVDITAESPDEVHLFHGTAVTAATLYGLVEPGSSLIHPGVHVDSYRVLPSPEDDFEMYWVLERIKEKVVEGGYQIVNLSMGPDQPVEDDAEPHLWTSQLDQLAWEYDVLIVAAVGNNGSEDQEAGLNRIQVPADMANGLSVGACDAPAPVTKWDRAPYSPLGPGRQGNRVQPTGLQFGGVAERPFPAIMANGRLVQDQGTSYSAPVVTHAIAELARHLPQPTASTLRAFVAHFAERPSRAYKRRQNEVGHGRLPLSFLEALDCEPDQLHVLYVDEIERGQTLGYQVPIPNSWQEDLSMGITLAYLSPVEPSQPTEYTQASLDLILRPNHLAYNLNPPAGIQKKPIKLQIGSPEAVALLESGWTPSQEPVAKPLTEFGTKHESDLRVAGKWETLRRYTLKLSGQEIAEPRFELSYLARRAGGLQSHALSVPFSLIVTLEDKSRQGTLYDRAVAQYQALVPVSRIAPTIQVMN